MKNILNKLPEQLSWRPEIKNADKLKSAANFVIGGMGGSALSGSLIKGEGQMPNLILHMDYGLPALTAAQKSSALFIAISHSGNTEETLDFADKAISHNLPLAVITRGGKLGDFAIENKLPLVILPTDEFPPRLSTGYIAVALLAIMGMKEKMSALAKLAPKIKNQSAELESEAAKVTEKIGSRIPIVYSSEQNQALAHYLKIAFNETPKIPAFFNWYPELNHNEMSGFTLPNSAEKFCLITVGDTGDHPRIVKRMMLTEKLLADRGATTARISLAGENRLEKFWRFFALAARISINLAGQRNVEPLSTELIENFKKSLES